MPDGGNNGGTAPVTGSPTSTTETVTTEDGPKRLSVEASLRPRKAGLTKAQLNEQLDAYSERTSTNLRSLVFGDLGLTWLLLLRKAELQSISSRISEYTLFIVAGACVLALTLDVLQYVFAEQAVDETFDRAEKSESGTATYNSNLLSYRAQLWCYRGKQGLAALATLLLLATLTRAII